MLTKDQIQTALTAYSEVFDVAKNLTIRITAGSLSLSWFTGTGRKRRSYEVDITPHGEDPVQFMVSDDKHGDISLCNDIPSAVENAVGELIHRVLLEEYEWKA